MGRVTQDWIEKCSLKQQTVLLSSIRGCDTVGKDDISKEIVRALRSTVLNNADPQKGDFMKVRMDDEVVDDFIRNSGGYPLHFISHIMDAAEVIAYMHPDNVVQHFWYMFYYKLASSLHLTIETMDAMEYRLQDRIE